MTSAQVPALVADIGGTNTRVALALGPDLIRASIKRFRNADYSGLDAILQEYLEGSDAMALTGVCIAIAGPVENGVGQMTNLNWRITPQMLGRVTGCLDIAILNDLQAQGYALNALAPGSLSPLLEGPKSGPNATRLVVGVGTGFNIAVVHTGPHGALVPPSETGHTSLPVSTEQELALAEAMKGEDGFAAVEDVISGRGLGRVYQWVAAQNGRTVPADAAVVSAGLTSGDDPDAEEAGRIFVRCLGKVAGNLALNFLPMGGLYFCGGVARATAPHFDRFGFAEAFREKGRFSSYMSDFSGWLIEDDYAALTGCGIYLNGLHNA